jgi:hypothetical protein
LRLLLFSCSLDVVAQFGLAEKKEKPGRKLRKERKNRAKSASMAIPCLQS